MVVAGEGRSWTSPCRCRIWHGNAWSSSSKCHPWSGNVGKNESYGLSLYPTTGGTHKLYVPGKCPCRSSQDSPSHRASTASCGSSTRTSQQITSCVGPCFNLHLSGSITLWLSVSLSIYVSIYLSIYLSLYLSIYISSYIHILVYFSLFFLSLSLSLCPLFMYIYIYIGYLFIIYIYIYIYVCMIYINCPPLAGLNSSLYIQMYK